MKNKGIMQFIAGVLLLVGLTLIAGLGSQEASLVHVNDMKEYKVRVAVIAGHGDVINREYQTYGKQSPEWTDGLKVYEGRSTHDLALRLVLKLRNAEIDAELVNPELSDISLKERVYRCNMLHMFDRRTVCVFLHHNAQSSNPKYTRFPPDFVDEEGNAGWLSIFSGGATGIEVFTYFGQSKSDDLATFIINELENTFPDITMRKDMSDGDPDKEAGFYVLKYTSGPAVLIEFLFMTTYPDCKTIADPVAREKYLDAIVRAIIKYDEL
ncbi:MAG: N-acetylmuramoyl-L-alanine amidase [Bacteroidales bacterium]|jgi:N-acetylmuramoyl-L-alanine amidase|nr:N-acetylmuramoyl-L-alanine amidase [Bacteroidales bacterium]